MEMIMDFLYRHKVFLIIFFVVFISYYVIFFAVYGKKKRNEKKQPIIKNISDLDKKDKNISILAPELDAIPVVEDQVSTSGEITSDENDWKKVLEEIKNHSDKLNHDQVVDDYIDDLLSDSDSETED